MSLTAPDVSILLPAFCAELLVTATQPLGMPVLARGIVFIDLAIAQIAGCGVLLADQLGFEPEGAGDRACHRAGRRLAATWTEASGRKCRRQ